MKSSQSCTGVMYRLSGVPNSLHRGKEVLMLGEVIEEPEWFPRLIHYTRETHHTSCVI